jgi:hypothetical protein
MKTVQKSLVHQLVGLTFGWVNAFGKWGRRLDDVFEHPLLLLGDKYRLDITCNYLNILTLTLFRFSSSPLSICNTVFGGMLEKTA